MENIRFSNSGDFSERIGRSWYDLGASRRQVAPAFSELTVTRHRGVASNVSNNQPVQPWPRGPIRAHCALTHPS